MHSSIKKTYNNLLRFIPLIDKWLIGQLIPPLIFSISAFTVVSLSVGVMFDLIRKIVEFGLPFSLALKILFLKLPGFLVLSFPMSVLLSTLLTYGKLSSNSELLALKSIGIKTSRFVLPALIISIFMTGLTFFFNDSLVPYSNKLAEISMREGLGKSTVIEKGNDVFFPGYGSLIDPKTNKPSERNTYLTQIFFSRVVENKIMKNVTLLDFSRIGSKQVLSAETASFDNDNGGWTFNNGQIVYFSDNNQTSIINFEQYFYPLGNGPLQISEIAGKEGYHLREELIKRLGEPKKGAYNLHLNIETTKLNEVITPSNEITSYRLIMIAKYSITTKNGVEVLPIQKSIARTGFGSASNSTGYKTQIAEEAAKKRLALKIAEEISTRLLILSAKWLQ